MHLNINYSKLCIGKHFSDEVPVHNSLKQGDASSPFVLNFALENASRKIQETYEGLELNGHMSFLSVLMLLIYWVET
jgi:hypothetical protein